MNYFNTTNLKDRELKEVSKKASYQETIVLEFFKKHKGMQFGPTGIWMSCFNPEETPLTSVRRAITNLTNKGKLTKTENKLIGIYGRKEYLWIYNI